MVENNLELGTWNLDRLRSGFALQSWLMVLAWLIADRTFLVAAEPSQAAIVVGADEISAPSNPPYQTLFQQPFPPYKPGKEGSTAFTDLGSTNPPPQFFDIFLEKEVDLVFPHLSSALRSPVTLNDGSTTQVNLPNAHLNTTVAPLVRLGLYRLGNDGEVSISYRFITTDGDDALPSSAGPTDLHTRFNLQTIRFDYANHAMLAPELLFRWEIGLNLQGVYFDTTAQNPASFQHATNNFLGAGPRGALALAYDVSEQVSIFGKVEGALSVGYNSTQGFAASQVTPAGILTGNASQEEVKLSPYLAARLGIAWTPRALPRARFQAGCIFEEWYNIGRVNDSFGNLSLQGLFVSGQWNF